MFCYFYAPSLLLLMQKCLKIKINEKNSPKVKMSSKNKPIVDFAMNGTTPKNIAKMLNKLLSSVYTLINCFHMTGCIKEEAWQWFEEVSSNSSVDQSSQGSIFSESSAVNEENG